MVLFHLLLNHLELLELVEVCQLLLIPLDSFIEAVDLHFLLAMDVDVSFGVVEVLRVDVLARVLLLALGCGALIGRGLLLLFLLQLDLVLAHLLDESIEMLAQLQLFLRHVYEGKVLEPFNHYVSLHIIFKNLLIRGIRVSSKKILRLPQTLILIAGGWLPLIRRLLLIVSLLVKYDISKK